MKQLIRALLLLKIVIQILIEFIVGSIGLITYPIIWVAYYIITGKNYNKKEPWFIDFIGRVSEIKYEE